MHDELIVVLQTPLSNNELRLLCEERWQDTIKLMDKLDKFETINANLLKALEELVKCHAEGGFILLDDDMLDEAKQAIAKVKP